jgi:hypothetical protein
MKYTLSEGWDEETPEAKLREALEKTPAERLREAFAWMVFTEKLRQTELPDDRSTFTTVQVLERPQG